MSDKGNNKEKCTKDICKLTKFTLILTLKYQSGKTEKLKGHFMSKSGVGGCDLPDQKPFKKARKKLLDSWKKSQKGNTDKSKATDNSVTNINTQVTHNSGQEIGCANCTFTVAFKQLCGCFTEISGKCGSCP